MAFIELESAEIEHERFLINADDIVEVSEGKGESIVYTQRYRNQAEYRVSTLYDEIYNRLMTDGQETSYRKGWEDGANAAAEHFRLCKEERPETKTSTCDDILKIIRREIEAMQMPIMRECDNYNKGKFEGLSQALEIVERFEGDGSCT